MDSSSPVTGSQLVAKLGVGLATRDEKLAVAESCTGGELLALLSAPAGASNWLWGGWVVYSNQAKLCLGVARPVIEEQGAVSRAAVAALCDKAREHSGVAASLALSGIAGPEGGAPTKPVGSVWIGASYREKSREEQQLFHGDRAGIRTQACEAALGVLLQLMYE